MRTMNLTRTIMLGACALVAASLTACTAPRGGTPVEKRANIDQMHSDTIAELYRQKPEVRDIINRSPGYAAFTNIGTNIIFVSTGSGYGVVVDRTTGEKTYMRMGELGVGLGLGLKDFRAVFVFHDEETMRRFVDTGWEFGAEADATAKSGEKGGSASGAATASSGMSIYQFTEAGVALSATVSGTKYWKDDALN